MTATHTSRSRAVRARLNHPVIDSDGHTVEFEPAVLAAIDCHLAPLGVAKLAGVFPAASTARTLQTIGV